jgi:phage-related protein
MEREIVFYKTKKGKCPVEDFLDSLNSKIAKKVVWVLKIIKELNIVPKNYFKKLVGTDNIWEVRIKVDRNIYRIFCFFAGNKIVVLTHGIKKKSQKTSKREIEKAEEYRKEYLKIRRGDKNG